MNEDAFTHRIEPMPPTIYDAADAFERGEGSAAVATRNGHPMAARFWRGWVQIAATGCVGIAAMFEEVSDGE